MKIVSIKFKKGIKKRIRDTQKEYSYMCPIDDINIGEYVLLEVHINKRDDFQVGRVEKVMDLPLDKSFILPEGFVICKIPVKDFEKRCLSVKKWKNNQISMNEKNAKYNALSKDKVK